MPIYLISRNSSRLTNLAGGNNDRRLQPIEKLGPLRTGKVHRKTVQLFRKMALLRGNRNNGALFANQKQRLRPLNGSVFLLQHGQSLGLPSQEGLGIGDRGMGDILIDGGAHRVDEGGKSLRQALGVELRNGAGRVSRHGMPFGKPFVAC